MKLSLPIYVEARKDRERKETVYRCTPLFVPHLHGENASLSKAFAHLLKRLRPYLEGLGKEDRHDALAAAVDAPPFESHLLKLKLDLRERLWPAKLLFVVLARAERQLAFSPSVPEASFEVLPDQSLAARAGEVLTQHFREKLKTMSDFERDGFAPPLVMQAWMTTLDIDLPRSVVAPKQGPRKFASLWDMAPISGSEELQRVGRCLDWLFPDELQRATLREREVDELTRLLSGLDRRPVLLVGPRLSGKSAVLQECVYRRVAGRKRPYASRRNVWLISPQRLISGMSYVGQWENRLLAILKETRRKDHVLYFDELLGLYQAGISRCSRLCAADVLRNFVLRREVRVLGEMSPEAFHRFQERDRGLADQFHVLRIEPTGEDDTLRILLHARRELEERHRCQFLADALPAAIELHRRFVRDAAFPGKAAGFLRQVAMNNAKAEVGRATIFQEFHARTGLSLRLLDNRRKLDRAAVEISFRTQVVGQDEAVEAATDLIMVAKAGLNDPTRPLATLLFLGPTGVGKTQCAKALAEALFTDATRLLRFDMNEFVSAYSAARLIGTPDEPEGLLTSAVRRQPFSVVLLDEIEKAHPDVFDLLLQVTGEGRLTDAWGRTTDFTNTVIVMTSNLGVREAGRKIGLVAEEAGRRETFLKAAADFFRPEFFNRLDRIIPFSALSRDQIRSIALLLLRDLLGREGLVRRRCVLDVDPAALERIVDEGYHPQLGARALKRAIERQLAQPAANRLATLDARIPTVIGVHRGPNEIITHVQPLENVAPVAIPEWSPEETVEQVERLLDGLAGQIVELRPQHGFTVGQLSAAELCYFALREQLRKTRAAVELLRQSLSEARPHAGPPASGTPVRRYSSRVSHMPLGGGSDKDALREILAAQDIHEYVRDVLAAGELKEDDLSRIAIEARREAALLAALWRGRDAPDRVVVVYRSVGRSEFPLLHLLVAAHRALFQNQLDFEVEELKAPAGEENRVRIVRYAGPAISLLLHQEAGVHLVCRQPETLLPIQVDVLASRGGEEQVQAHEFLGLRSAWLERLAHSESDLSSDPTPLGPVVRLYDVGQATIDFRTGRTVSKWPGTGAWRDFLLDGLTVDLAESREAAQ